MKNMYMLMIIQALLTLLLFFSEGYMKYATIGLFLLIDLILFVSLLNRKWSVEELLVFAAIFCSGVFMLFYVFMKSVLTTIFGVSLMLLFLVVAMIDYISQSTNKVSHNYTRKFDALQMPETPAHYYDVEYNLDYDSSNVKKVPEPVMHVVSEKKPSEVKNKLTAKAVAYELEREVTELKHAEKLMKDLQIYNTEKELLRETRVMQDAQKQMDIVNAAIIKNQSITQLKNETAELKKEAAEMIKVQKQIDNIKKIKALEADAVALNSAQKQINNLKNINLLSKKVNVLKKVNSKNNDADKIKALQKEVATLNKAESKIKDVKKIIALQKEAKALKKAETQIRELQFLDKQEKIVKQAKAIAKAQKEIDGMNKNTKKSMVKQASSPTKVKEIVRVQTIKAKDESFYFATEDGNKFHEPGCLVIKKVPKNKLILYTNKKDAMKKGLQACSVCIPK